MLDSHKRVFQDKILNNIVYLLILFRKSAILHACIINPRKKHAKALWNQLKIYFDD